MAHVIDYESIIQNAENIGKDSELLSKIEMDEKYKEFKERYPKFYLVGQMPYIKKTQKYKNIKKI